MKRFIIVLLILGVIGMLKQKAKSIEDVEIGEFFYDYEGNKWMKLGEEKAALVLNLDFEFSETLH